MSRGCERRSASWPSRKEAERFLRRSEFVWHQRFELVPGVPTPGESPVIWILEQGDFPQDLTGASVLDIGTANGGAAFEAERRGAARVVAVDIYPKEWFGVGAIKDFLGSKVEFVQASLYDLPAKLGGERFDIVLFLGVLYHLRHPLLGLDAVWQLSADDGLVLIETQIADGDLGPGAELAVARFYRQEFAGDASNWFVPTTAALVDWCHSCGLEPRGVSRWPDQEPVRALISARRDSVQEFPSFSYEQPLRGVTLSGGDAVVSAES